MTSVLSYQRKPPQVPAGGAGTKPSRISAVALQSARKGTVLGGSSSSSSGRASERQCF